MKILIIPDSFKGTLSSLQAARLIAASFRNVFPGADIQAVPLADGGEGTLQALLNAGTGKHVATKVQGADHVWMETGFLRLNDNSAVLEAAQVVGLPLLKTPHLPVSQRDTFGIGQQIKEALESGVRKITVGIGGSSTNDGGAGLLNALGVKFFNTENREIAPWPESMKHLKEVDFSSLDHRVKEAAITVLCDVDNPLCGPEGASFTYGPQKGVRKEELPLLDETIKIFSKRCAESIGRDYSGLPGAGAAGGLGFALLTLGADLKPGAQFFIELTGLEEKIANADLVITGEGRSDFQTLRGKLPFAVANVCKRHQVPVFLLSGSLEAETLPALKEIFTDCFSVVDDNLGLEEVLANPEPSLEQAAEKVARSLSSLPFFF